MSETNGILMAPPRGGVCDERCCTTTILGAASLSLLSFVPTFIGGMVVADKLMELGGRTVDMSCASLVMCVGFAAWSLFLLDHVRKTGSTRRMLCWLAAIGHTMGMLAMSAGS